MFLYKQNLNKVSKKYTKMSKIILFIVCSLPLIFTAVPTNSTALYPPLSSTRGIDLLVPFPNSKDLSACLETEHAPFISTFLVYNMSSAIAASTNHTIYSYTLPNGTYLDRLTGLNSYGNEYFAGVFE